MHSHRSRGWFRLALVIGVLGAPIFSASAQPDLGDPFPMPDMEPLPPPPGDAPADDVPPDSGDDYSPEEPAGITEDSILSGLFERFPCEVVVKNKGARLFTTIKRARVSFNKFAKVAAIDKDELDWGYIRDEAESYVDQCSNDVDDDEDEGDDY